MSDFITKLVRNPFFGDLDRTKVVRITYLNVVYSDFIAGYLLWPGQMDRTDFILIIQCSNYVKNLLTI